MGIFISRIREYWSPYRKLISIDSQIRYYKKREKEVITCMNRLSKYACNIAVFCHGIIYIILLIFFRDYLIDINYGIYFIMFPFLTIPFMWFSLKKIPKFIYNRELTRIRAELYNLSKELRRELDSAKETIPYNQYIAVERKYNSEILSGTTDQTVSGPDAGRVKSADKEATLIQLDDI